MKPKNGRLIAMVAAVAVAAVVTGGVVAARQGPNSGDDAAAPLAGFDPTTATPTPKPSPTPSTPLPSTPSAPKTTPPPKTTTAPISGPTQVKLKLSDLPKGRAPQMTYLVDREVRGGAGYPEAIPGNGVIVRIARLGVAVLAVQTKDAGTELLRVRYATDFDRIPDVSSLVTTADGSGAAYATTLRRSTGGALKGSTVYAEAGAPSPYRLSLPNAWEVRVLAFIDRTVYFRSTDKEVGSTHKLYAWVPGKSAAREVKTVSSPTGLSADASVAASLTSTTAYGTCSALVRVATGKSLWRTCDYLIRGFTPDGSVALVEPPDADGYAPTFVAALDRTSGSLLREWSGLSFLAVAPEDDQHLLMVVDNGPETKAAIIRCSITTGDCELTTTIANQHLALGS
jgi:hypothetical protein